ncbi:hypothetical protein CUC06_11165 [Akkermansia muciniphila]|nr:hypothetical protein CUC06_11165 [Akkermansia muciniphila]
MLNKYKSLLVNVMTCEKPDEKFGLFFCGRINYPLSNYFFKKRNLRRFTGGKTDWQIIENICECFLAELISNFMIYNKYNLIFNQL